MLAELLTDLEADTALNAVTDEGGMTPLMLASHFGFVELVSVHILSPPFLPPSARPSRRVDRLIPSSTSR